jgi:hypothetical protein
MNIYTYIQDLMKKYYDNEIKDKDELISLSKDRITKSDFVQALETSFEIKNRDETNNVFQIGFVLSLFDLESSSILKKMIKETWHTRHEDIASLFQIDIKDPSCVDDIVEAMYIKCDYWIDDGDAFIRKCAYVLGDLKTSYSIQKLEELAVEENECISEYASYQLAKIEKRRE